MEPFTIIQAQNTQAAFTAMAKPDSVYIGGGTNLIDLMKMYVERPHQLVDITGLNMKKVEATPSGGVRVGALVRNTEFAYDPMIVQKYPVLSEAILAGASAQLRNMATTGGNVLQRTRCPYFFNVTFPCNKRVPGSGCSAIPGFNRMHAVLGTSDKCIAVHPSDMAVALMALDADIHVQSAKGDRTIPITQFYLTPGDTPQRENVLEHGELITAIELPNIPYATRSHYLKVRDRASYAFALTSAGVALDVNNGTIREARIALGGVGTIPWRATEAEKVLKGAANNAESYQLAANAALKDAKGYKYNNFKIELAKRTIVSALTTAGGQS